MGKLAALLLGTLMVAGCQGSATTALPQCAHVWIVGARLPDPYAGCMGDGGVVAPTREAGRVTFMDRLAADPGGVIGPA